LYIVLRIRKCFEFIYYLNGYKIFRQDRDLNFYTRGTYTQTSRGGTLLLVKNYLNPTLFVLTPENAQTIQLIYDHSCQKAHLYDNLPQN
jgi:hypothetical protein